MSNHKHTFLLTVAAALSAHLLISYFGEKPVARTAVAATTVSVSEPTLKTAEEKFARNPLPKHTKPLPGHNKSRLDVAFCIDTTSSMEAEIETVKAEVTSVVKQLTSQKHHPKVRIGLVAYRDDGDDYITKVYPFNEDVQKVVKDIADLTADGGGDEPEAVDRGVHTALNELQWDQSKDAAKLLFVIGDAPAHPERASALTAEAKEAVNRGIRINTVGCDGLESSEGDGVRVFKEIARLTNGSYEPLTYQEELVDSKGKHATVVSYGGAKYFVDPSAAAKWKSGASKLIASGSAKRIDAPMLQGATNGTIGPQGFDATVLSGVNTAGTVRANNNLDSLMLQGAESVLGEFTK